MDLNAGRRRAAGLSDPADAPSVGWPQPRAAYIHIPFCRHRCGYCNFSVVAGRDDLIDRFLSAIDHELKLLDCPAVQTVFIGGGTPTHLDDQRLDRLLTMIENRLTIERGAEWSVEANPEDITKPKLDVLARHGVNRISLGVQSFQDTILRTLERGHHGDLARAAIELAASVIDRVSVDLIFAAPNESTDQWAQDLQTALALPIGHLSTYALTLEKGTSFWSRHHRGQLTAADEAVEVEMYQMARRLAADADLEQYEVSNFARHGERCRHNLAYWSGQGWFAAGPGAARFVDGVREVNHRSTSTYLRRIESGQAPTAESEAITTEQYARERAAFGVRLMEGVDLDAISSASDVDIGQLCREAIEVSIDEGLVNLAGSRLLLTEQGILFADTVASRLLG